MREEDRAGAEGEEEEEGKGGRGLGKSSQPFHVITVFHLIKEQKCSYKQTLFIRTRMFL